MAVENESERVFCAMCGTAEAIVPMTWTSSVERGELRYYCDKCSRDNLRAIEGRLDQEWF